MKKLPKSFTIIASCMIVLGILLAIIGYTAGARFSIISTNDGLKVLSPEDRKIETFPLSDFTRINGNLLDANIEIIPSDEYKLEIERQKDKEITHEVKNDTLIIEGKDQETKQLFNFNLSFTSIAKSDIKIYVPKEANFSEISLENKFGDTRLEGMVSDNLKINTTDGDITFNNVNSNELKIVNKFGDIRGSKIKTKDLTIEMNDGDIVFNDVDSNKLNIKNKFGDITGNKVETKDLKIELTDGNAVFDDVNAESTVLDNRFGDIKFGNFNSHGLNIKGQDGDIVIQGLLLGTSAIHSSFGDVKLQLLNKESELSYNIKNKFGDILVNKNQFENKATYKTNTKHNLDITSNDGDVNITF